MNRLHISAVLGVLSLAVFVPSLHACDPKPRRCTPGPRVVTPPPVPTPAVEDDGSEVGDGLVWDLPADAKTRIAKAAKDGATGRRAPGRAARPGSRGPAGSATPQRRAAEPPASETAERPQGGSFHDRVTRAVAAEKALAAANTRLEAKLAELERWDAVAQEKFHRAFGTTDERVRQAVVQRIEQQREKNLRLMAAIADSVNFEFYMQSKKPR
jgi:hypothetical protein